MNNPLFGIIYKCRYSSSFELYVCKTFPLYSLLESLWRVGVHTSFVILLSFQKKHR